MTRLPNEPNRFPLLPSFQPYSATLEQKTNVNGLLDHRKKFYRSSFRSEEREKPPNNSKEIKN